MISITPLAVVEAKKVIAKNAGKSLRISVFRGGCSGFMYDFGFDSKKSADEVISQDGVDVVIDKKSLEMIKGSTLDYSKSLQNRGFIIKNPNAKHVCGCGKSFV